MKDINVENFEFGSHAIPSLSSNKSSMYLTIQNVPTSQWEFDP